LNIGCNFADINVSLLAYADDLVLLSDVNKANSHKAKARVHKAKAKAKAKARLLQGQDQTN